MDLFSKSGFSVSRRAEKNSTPCFTCSGSKPWLWTSSTNPVKNLKLVLPLAAAEAAVLAAYRNSF